MANPSSDPQTYWASVPNSKVAAANTLERIRRYRETLKNSGRAARMRRGFNTMYGRAPDGGGDTSRTSSSGDQGEYVDVTLNNFATLVTQSVVRTTANKPAFKAIATNADSASMMQANFGQGLLDYYTNTYSLADRDWEMVEIGCVCHEGWEVFGWDTTKGKNLTDFSDEESIKEGDIEVHATTPFRVAYDPDAESIDSLEWFCFRRRYNRFVLAANADPETREKLLTTREQYLWRDDEDDLDLDVMKSRVEGDLVWVWELRHLPTDALPKGRLLRFVDAECVLLDSIKEEVGEMGETVVNDRGYPYDPDELHAYRYCPATVIGNIAGHAPSSDLLGLQELKDTVATQAATAANAGGITNLWSTLGDKPVVSSVVGSMNFLQSKTKPEILQGVELSAQIPAFDAMLTENMQARMGESDVSMGNVPKGMPGNLAALLEAKTVQYNSRGQQSYAHVLERSRTGLLKMLKRFAKTPRVAVLGGISEGYEFKEWSAEDLSGVDRFVVEAVNPLTQTYSGKMDAAKELLEHGLVTDAKQFLLLRETGRLEPLLESETSTRMGVRKEKELLLQGVGLAPVDVEASFAAAAANPGKPPAPVFTDDGQPHIRPLIYDKHWLHIQEDLGAIALPQARDDGKIAEAVMGVVEERKRLLKLMDPVMLAVLGCPPEIAQAIMMSQMPPPMPGMESGTPPPKPGASDETKNPEVGGLPESAPRISAPKPAKPPPDPITGAQAPSPVEAVQ